MFAWQPGLHRHMDVDIPDGGRRHSAPSWPQGAGVPLVGRVLPGAVESWHERRSPTRIGGGCGVGGSVASDGGVLPRPGLRVALDMAAPSITPGRRLGIRRLRAAAFAAGMIIDGAFSNATSRGNYGALALLVLLFATALCSLTRRRMRLISSCAAIIWSLMLVAQVDGAIANGAASIDGGRTVWATLAAAAAPPATALAREPLRLVVGSRPILRGRVMLDGMFPFALGPYFRERPLDSEMYGSVEDVDAAGILLERHEPVRIVVCPENVPAPAITELPALPDANPEIARSGRDWVPISPLPREVALSFRSKTSAMRATPPADGRCHVSFGGRTFDYVLHTSSGSDESFRSGCRSTAPGPERRPSSGFDSHPKPSRTTSSPSSQLAASRACVC